METRSGKARRRVCWWGGIKGGAGRFLESVFAQTHARTRVCSCIIHTRTVSHVAGPSAAFPTCWFSRQRGALLCFFSFLQRAFARIDRAFFHETEIEREDSDFLSEHSPCVASSTMTSSVSEAPSYILEWTSVCACVCGYRLCGSVKVHGSSSVFKSDACYCIWLGWIIFIYLYGLVSLLGLLGWQNFCSLLFKLLAFDVRLNTDLLLFLSPSYISKLNENYSTESL